jgi:hypothetical protein
MFPAGWKHTQSSSTDENYKGKLKRERRIVSICSFRIVFQADHLTGAQLLKGAYMYTLGINVA